MAEKTIPKAESCRRSETIQYDGKNEREACRTIPSSMALARRASRSDRRAKAGCSVLMEEVRPTAIDIEPGLPFSPSCGEDGRADLLLKVVLINNGGGAAPAASRARRAGRG